MSLYNMVHGINEIVVFFILPMLDNHPDEYPRFRDAFIEDPNHPEYDNHIHVFTRCYNEEEFDSHPNFVGTFTENEDSTYRTFVFSVPEKWKEDFDKIITKRVADVSDEYKAQMNKVYPKLEEQFKEFFSMRESNKEEE